ncbi:28S ribosomal protein S6, mitochondrial [Terramyces sp. JEL0728]|nr:28S ribosomal protein S6, mitochondrial [Terramyces sp. JEL0728]
MLYELLLIAKSNTTRDIPKLTAQNEQLKSLLTFCAKHVLDSNGVVREITNLGQKQLPYRMKRHQEIFDQGQYFSMKFDSSAQTMFNLKKALNLNETVIRNSIVKLGSSLASTTDYVPPEKM